MFHKHLNMNSHTHMNVNSHTHGCGFTRVNVNAHEAKQLPSPPIGLYPEPTSLVFILDCDGHSCMHCKDTETSCVHEGP
jgi:hypothetical protein